ncbi:class I SAM-dependent methyltransferase [Deinococcus frigens]|uniref:class I SAM-dependent methyltransferase n=1 Tax=Deinococcus frigens TaxID=249403 RepID=UPI001FE16179|nr:class I SAM-dependent methyltransferase [Deinococcus frigens]
MLLGPLYHLTDMADRVSVLTEARRVLRPGGVIVAAVIPRVGVVCGDCPSAAISCAACRTSRILAPSEKRRTAQVFTAIPKVEVAISPLPTSTTPPNWQRSCGRLDLGT